ncbi:hypothetical protein [Pedobacter sp. GR22-10]|uniref:hypothetical protein n=1 Tax=Pedobacter sp. GR22-10 TaxID=2994472 RepID=UPI0022450EC0|nr:hypothetical protein [Pedobacter sp. GR22-10]MCX2429375.1 hypothetical protein [Pedobacter sp. GR22-10]
MITANLFWFDYTCHFLPLLTAIRSPPHPFRSYLRDDYTDGRITVIIFHAHRLPIHAFRSYLRDDYTDGRITVIISMLIAHRHTLSALTFGMITQMKGLL